jgi:hypothetical protein
MEREEVFFGWDAQRRKKKKHMTCAVGGADGAPQAPAPPPPPPPALIAALARLRALASGGAADAASAHAQHACDGGGEFGCSACAGVADVLGDRLAAFLEHGPPARAAFLAAGGAGALVVSFLLGGCFLFFLAAFVFAPARLANPSHPSTHTTQHTGRLRLQPRLLSGGRAPPGRPARVHARRPRLAERWRRRRGGGQPGARRRGRGRSQARLSDRPGRGRRPAG